MGTSLSGLTPATTFDGLLKTSDNQPLDGTLKAISTGDGTDTMLELSTTALQIGGATGMYWDNTNKRLGINNTSPAAALEVAGEIRCTSFIRLMVGGSNKVLMQSSNTVIDAPVSIGKATAPTARLDIKGSGATSATTSLLVQNSAGAQALKITDDGITSFGTNSNINAVNNKLTIYNTASSFLKVDQQAGFGTNFTATERVKIQGLGNDNTTTSLLVQNSDGDDMLKVTDDKRVYIGDTVSDVMPSLLLNGFASFAHLNAYSSIDLRIRNSSALSINNTKKIGVNTTSPTAQLQVKGSGATSATTALLVQNSAGTNVIKANDDGRVLLGAGTSYQNHLLELNGQGLGSAQTLLRLQSSVNFNGAYTGIGFTNSTNGASKSSEIRSYRESYGNALTFNFSGTEMLRATSDGNLGIGETTPTARLHVKGSGNDNTTTALLVQNSDGDDMLKVDDSGITTFSVNSPNGSVPAGFELQPSYSTNPTWGPSIKSYYNNSKWLQISKSANYYTFADSGLGINMSTTPSAELHVKGSGATSATTALLVQNSAGTDLLKVTDDGNLRIANNAFQIQTSQMVSYRPGIFGGAGRNASAVLQADSTTQGFLPPRMTTTERDAISTPASGLMVYNTTTNKAQCYNGTAWQDLF